MVNRLDEGTDGRRWSERMISSITVSFIGGTACRRPSVLLHQVTILSQLEYTCLEFLDGKFNGVRVRKRTSSCAEPQKCSKDWEAQSNGHTLNPTTGTDDSLASDQILLSLVKRTKAH
jgi:hypothetical protein